jgi:hypothetical protein
MKGLDIRHALGHFLGSAFRNPMELHAWNAELPHQPTCREIASMHQAIGWQLLKSELLSEDVENLNAGLEGIRQGPVEIKNHQLGLFFQKSRGSDSSLASPENKTSKALNP